MLNDQMVVDSSVKGNNSRFLNHSCDPNCTTKKWIVKGEERCGESAVCSTACAVARVPARLSEETTL